MPSGPFSVGPRVIAINKARDRHPLTSFPQMVFGAGRSREDGTILVVSDTALAPDK